jgi:hypothetical protein
MQLDRIRKKLQARHVSLDPPLSEGELQSFERLHGIVLPECYRLFLLTIGDGGIGPPSYGLAKLGKVASDMQPEQQDCWSRLTKIRQPFPFTKCWVWDNHETSDEGSTEDLENGSIYIGNDGCGMYWHLVVTGPDRGIPWMICGEGIQPVCPKRDFLQWYEDWLDGRDSFYGYESPTP